MKFAPLLLLAALAVSVSGCSGKADESEFFRVENGCFKPAEGYSDQTSLYYIGTNFWYGAIIGSDTVYGDRDRLVAELDSLKSLGLDNLRILVGGDGPSGIPSQIEPSLQTEAGAYDENVFEGLDFLLAEMGKRRMSAVLYLNNSWEWSGGYGRYLEWAGAGEAVLPSVSGWPAYMDYASGFVTNEKAKALFADHVRTVVSRTNTVTGVPYKDDPTIFSWQIANEPRCFSDSDSVRTAFAEWLWETAALIKSIDANHMVSTGSEGSWGCENDMALFEKIHSCPDIDYMTIHIWPYNWSWISEDSVEEDLERAIENTGKYIDAHEVLAEKYGRPLVIEEFGFPRDGFSLEKGTPTTARDAYYSYLFDRLIASKKECGALAGLNFWGWGGAADQLGGVKWQPGADYCGDPAQEPQGLNSVYLADSSTVNLIRTAAEELDDVSGISAEAVLENDWMYSSSAPAELKVAVRTACRKGFEPAVAVEIATDKGELVASFGTVPSKGEDTLVFRQKLSPGFHTVTLSSPAYSEKRSFNIGCDPGKIVSPQDKQPDFDEFWSRTLAELADVAPDWKLILIPERSNDIRRIYRVDMRSFGGEHISGVYIEPVKDGKYPVFINYIGYGSDVWYNDPSSRPKAIEFTLCVRNQALNRKPGEKDDWVTRGLGSRDTYYYRGAFMDVVRAIDFVTSREKADTSKIFAEGGSQGGAFTLIAASLDKRIKAIAPFVPFLSDFPDYFEIASWPAAPVFEEAERLGISREELFRTLSYFDVKNFTDRITCPVLMGFGLQDDVCPPHTNFSGYNHITSPKTYVTFPLAGHHVETESGWWAARDAFFEKQLHY